MNGENATNPKRLKREERRQQVMQLRRNGATLREIQTVLERQGHTADLHTIHADVKFCLARLAQETNHTTEQYRALELDRLDLATVAIAGRVRQGDLGAIDRWIRLSERRAALLGLDVPTTQRITLERWTPDELAGMDLQRLNALARANGFRELPEDD